MKKDINPFERMNKILKESEEVLDSFAAKMEQSEKDIKAYEEGFKKKNPLYKAFCNMKSMPVVSIDVAEDFAVHILADVLNKKIAGKSHEETAKVLHDYQDRLTKEIFAYRNAYAFELAAAVVVDEIRKEESDEQNTERDQQG